MNGTTISRTVAGLAAAFLCAFSPAAATAAPLCVNAAANAPAGCYTTIGAAVAAASVGSSIQVAPGIYKEDVTITKTMALTGVNGQTIVDATGKANGFFVNGTGSATGISGVTISGFTVKNANFEGILLVNVSGATVSGNTVTGNDKALVYSATNSTCPGQPAFETNEADDCGEGIHLMGVDHSVFANNIVEDNAGGILVSDETGPTYSNTITGNTVTDNALDCGITLASHGRAPNLPAGVDFGVYNNTVSGNTVEHNGSIGQGAGVGLYAAGPGALTYSNVVIGNTLTDNGLGGVTMHIHAAPGVAGVPTQAPAVDLNDNQIIGNQISGNQGDSDDPNSPGPTGISIVSVAPITGTVVSENTFGDEIVDITFSVPSGTLQAHLNNFTATAIAVALEAGGTVDATQSYFGCAAGVSSNAGPLPSAPNPGCATLMGAPIYVYSSLTAPFGGSGGSGGGRPGR